MDQYDRAHHHALSDVYAGHDPGVCAYGCHAMGLGLAGRPNAVRPVVDEALRLADSLEHPVTLAFRPWDRSHAMHLAGDVEGCCECSSRMLQVAERYDFTQQAAFASFMLGLVHSGGENLVRGLEQMEASFEAASTYRFAAGYPQIVMAEALMKAGRNQDALSVVTRALDAGKEPRARLVRLGAVAAARRARARHLRRPSVSRALPFESGPDRGRTGSEAVPRERVARAARLG
jgi:hypothetical protein